MTELEAKKANPAIEQFKSLIGDEICAQIDPEHFAELGLMIESAIDTAVFVQMDKISKELRDLAHRVRKDAEASVLS